MLDSYHVSKLCQTLSPLILIIFLFFILSNIDNLPLNLITNHLSKINMETLMIQKRKILSYLKIKNCTQIFCFDDIIYILIIFSYSNRVTCNGFLYFDDIFCIHNYIFLYFDYIFYICLHEINRDFISNSNFRYDTLMTFVFN